MHFVLRQRQYQLRALTPLTGGDRKRGGKTIPLFQSDNHKPPQGG